MGTNAVGVALLIYFVVGLIYLVAFDLITKRIRKRFKGASYETQSKMAGTGNYISTKTAQAILLMALWIFWPVVVYGALTKKKDG